MGIQVRRVIVWILILGLLFFAIAVIYFKKNGKQIVTEQLSEIFKRQVSLESVSYRFPRTIVLDYLEVEGLLWVVQAKIKLSISNIWRNDFVLSEVSLKAPMLSLHRSREGKIVFWEEMEKGYLNASSEQLPSIAKTNPPQSTRPINVIVKQLHVQNGKIYFPDHYASNPVELAVADIQLDAQNVPLTLLSMKSTFHLKGTIVAGHLPFLGDHIDTKGWLNWERRDLEAKISVEDSKSKLSFWADINSKANDCDVHGNIQLNEQALARQNPRLQIESIDDLVMGVLETTGMGIDLNFSFKTKLDGWQISQSDILFKGNLTRLTETSSDQKEQVMDDFKNISKQLEVLGAQTTNSIRE